MRRDRLLAVGMIVLALVALLLAVGWIDASLGIGDAKTTSEDQADTIAKQAAELERTKTRLDAFEADYRARGLAPPTVVVDVPPSAATPTTRPATPSPTSPPPAPATTAPPPPPTTTTTTPCRGLPVVGCLRRSSRP